MKCLALERPLSFKCSLYMRSRTMKSFLVSSLIRFWNERSALLTSVERKVWTSSGCPLVSILLLVRISLFSALMTTEFAKQFVSTLMKAKSSSEEILSRLTKRSDPHSSLYTSIAQQSIMLQFCSMIRWNSTRLIWVLAMHQQIVLKHIHGAINSFDTWQSWPTDTTQNVCWLHSKTRIGNFLWLSLKASLMLVYSQAVEIVQTFGFRIDLRTWSCSMIIGDGEACWLRLFFFKSILTGGNEFLLSWEIWCLRGHVCR